MTRPKDERRMDSFRRSSANPGNQVFKRAHHVLLNEASRYAEPFGHFAMREFVELVQPKRSLDILRQFLKRCFQTTQPIAGHEGIVRRDFIKNLFARGRDYARGTTPFRFAVGARSPMSQAIEQQVRAQTVEIGSRAMNFARVRDRGDLEVDFLDDVFSFLSPDPRAEVALQIALPLEEGVDQ